MPRHAWVKKVLEAKKRREIFLGMGGRGVSEIPRGMKVSGNFAIPVVLGNFANTTSPYPNTDLQTELFDGPWTTGTMSQFYSEISYGNVNLSGTVFNWVTVSQNDTYYEGTSNGLSPGNAHTGEFIKEILDALDGTTDFGAFDNDGPDGIPNSGDDDGFVDFIAIVHPETGGECGGSNIWSHTWAYSAWPINNYNPYTTNDASANGGFIKIDDYTIQPALACGGSNMIQIGVFCHEFGHAFGLPDLYDVDGGSSGIGNWGLMGSGNWNRPESPSHMCAWSKVQMGWVIPTDVSWQGAVQSIPQIETNPVCYRLPFSQDRFRKLAECAISGNSSLRCALTNAEGTTRQWKHGGGYGNLWDETIERDFTFDGTTPVTLTYDYAYETEVGYDYAYTVLSVGGSDTVLKTYNGTASGTETIDLTPILSGYTPPVDYKVKFRFISDYAWSDEDGKNPTTCGAFTVDNLSLVGGGENYSTGFESLIDGWYQDPSSNPPKEYWLVENREAVGFDKYLYSPGLLIWHVDDEVMNSALGNSGGGPNASNNTVRGLVLEEADGNGDLLAGTNRGDSGDAFPGSSSNTVFDSNSNPNSNNNNNRATQIEVSGISSAGATMTAFLKAGDPPPILTSVTPDTLDNDLVSFDVIVNGNKMRHGANFKFIKAGESDIVPSSVYWAGKPQLTGNINIYSKKPGYWKLVVTNPDGQTDTLPDALYLNLKVAAKLADAEIRPRGDAIELGFTLSFIDPGESITVLRSTSKRGPWSEPAWTVREKEGLNYRYLDASVEPGREYFYRVESRSSGGEVQILYEGSATVKLREVALFQNYPNPFNPVTTISFYLPERMQVGLYIYDVSGKLVRKLSERPFTQGLQQVSWDGKDEKGAPVASGIYVYRLKAGKKSLIRKMALIR